MPQRQKWSMSATHTSPSPTTVMQWDYPAPRLSMPFTVDNPNSARLAARDHHRRRVTTTSVETAPKHTHREGSRAQRRTQNATPVEKLDTGNRNAAQEPNRRQLEEANHLNAMGKDEELEARSPSGSMTLEQTSTLNSTKSQLLPLQLAEND